MCTTGLFISENFSEFALKLRVEGFAENTIECTCRNVKLFLRSTKLSPRRVGSDDIKNYVFNLHKSGRYALNSIRAKIRSLKLFYGYLHRSGQILCDPAAKLKEPEVKRSFPKDVLSSREMESIRKAISGTSFLKLRDKAIVEVLYSTGLRLSELAGLNIADTDLNVGILRVQKGKGGRDRRAVMNSGAVLAVITYLEQRRQSPDETNALWINYRGKRLSGQMIRNILKRGAKDADVKTPAYTHAWRHGLATSLLRQGANIVEVQRFLGHVSIRSTQIYTHILIRDLKEIHNRSHPRERDPIPSNITPNFSAVLTEGRIRYLS